MAENVVEIKDGTEEEVTVVETSKVKTILKKVGFGIAFVVTGIGGFLIGRKSVGDDDEDSNEETAE